MPELHASPPAPQALPHGGAGRARVAGPSVRGGRGRGGMQAAARDVSESRKPSA